MLQKIGKSLIIAATAVHMVPAVAVYDAAIGLSTIVGVGSVTYSCVLDQRLHPERNKQGRYYAAARTAATGAGLFCVGAVLWPSSLLFVQLVAGVTAVGFYYPTAVYPNATSDKERHMLIKRNISAALAAWSAVCLGICINQRARSVQSRR